jgi:uncharacterized protein YceH (UPF0502 family)
MSNTDYILELCFEISKQGKTPSVALIKNLSKQPLRIPEVVKALQHWKANPVAPAKSSTSKFNNSHSSKQSLEQRVAELESQVAKMSQLLGELNATNPTKPK